MASLLLLQNSIYRRLYYAPPAINYAYCFGDGTPAVYPQERSVLGMYVLLRLHESADLSREW